MNENEPLAPEAEIKNDTETINDENRQQYYVVSPAKFSILHLSTFGLYQVYWFYKNWQKYKIYNNTDIWPIPRGLFNIFFAHRLFENVQKTLNNDGKKFDWAPAGLATFYVLLAVTSNIFDRLAMKEIGSPATDLVSIVLFPAIYLILLRAQKAINTSQNDPEGNSNKKLTAANYIWIILGLALWGLVLLGLLAVFGVI